MSEIRPALTPEEWAMPLCVTKDGPVIPLDFGCGHVHEISREHHRIAALCLYGQPPGFTQDDVALLRFGAGQIEQGARWMPPGYSYSIGELGATTLTTERIRRYRDLADRIAALLPPEP